MEFTVSTPPKDSGAALDGPGGKLRVDYDFLPSSFMFGVVADAAYRKIGGTDEPFTAEGTIALKTSVTAGTDVLWYDRYETFNEITNESTQFRPVGGGPESSFSLRMGFDIDIVFTSDFGFTVGAGVLVSDSLIRDAYDAIFDINVGGVFRY